MKIIYLFLILILILISGCSNDISQQNTEPLPKDRCKIIESPKIINGNSMEPMLKNGDNVTLIESYYDCNEVQKGDIVAYNYAGTDNPAIKIVKATSEDYLELNSSKLTINDEIMKNSAGKEYTFSSKEQQMLSLYIHNGHIPKDSYFLFGDNTVSSADSRKFGAVSKEDIIGKFLSDR